MHRFSRSTKILIFATTLIFLTACSLTRQLLPVSSVTPQEREATPTLQPVFPPSDPGLQPASPATPAGPPVLYVAYVKDGNVWLWSEAGGSKALTGSGDATQVKLSSDGQIAAFLRQVDEFGVEIWAVNAGADGAPENERKLVGAEALESFDLPERAPFAKAIIPHNIQWVPGTHTLAFNLQQVFQGPGLSIFNDLRMVNADNLEALTFLPPGSGGVAHFSPDGRQVALATASTISLVNSDGSNWRGSVLTYHEVVTYSEYQYYAQPVWAADSGSLRVAIPPADPMKQPPDATTLWYIPVDGSPAVQMGGVVTMGLFGGMPAFSPDLERVAYLQHTGPMEDNLRELHIANADSSNDIVYHTFRLLDFHGWAGRSDRFVISQNDPGELKLAQLNGEMHPLSANASFVTNYTWVAGENFLYLQATPGDAWELHLATIGGGSRVLDTISGIPPSFDFAWRPAGN